MSNVSCPFAFFNDFKGEAGIPGSPGIPGNQVSDIITRSLFYFCYLTNR